jgi:hypothetical protein
VLAANPVAAAEVCRYGTRADGAAVEHAQEMTLEQLAGRGATQIFASQDSAAQGAALEQRRSRPPPPATPKPAASRGAQLLPPDQGAVTSAFYTL